MTQARTDVRERWAIALVHGVSVATPTEMITDVGRVLSEINPDLHLEDGIRSFMAEGPAPTYYRDGATNKSVVRMALTHWGDLSYVEPGLGGLLGTLRNLVTGLRDVALCAAANRSPEAAVVRRTLRVIFFLVLGPLLALYLTAFLLAITVLLWPNREPAANSDAFLAAISLVCLASCAVGLAMAIRRWRAGLSLATGWGPLWASLLLIAVLSALGLAYGPVEQLRAFFEARGYEPALIAGSQSCASDQPLALYLASNWYAQDLVMGAGLLAVSVSLLALACAIARRKFGSGASQEIRGLRAACAAGFVLWILFAFVVAPLDFVTASAAGASTGQTEYPHYWYEQALALWLILTALVFTVIFVMRRRRLADTRRFRPMRLLIAPALEAVLFLFAGMVAAFGIANTALVSAGSSDAIDPTWVPFWPIWLGLAIAAATAAVFSSGLRTALHAACDVVAHFAGPESEFPLRKRISRRFLETIRFLREGPGAEPQNLLIIAHSQGTVISLDALANDLWKQSLAGSFDRVTLLTFGSPFTHLYQHYFPHAYPRTNRMDAYGIPRDSFVWFNSYRVDDFVGTEVVGPEPNQQFAVGLGGHSDYWRSDVFEALRSVLPP